MHGLCTLSKDVERFRRFEDYGEKKLVHALLDYIYSNTSG